MNLIVRGLLYESIAFIIVYLVSSYWFQHHYTSTLLYSFIVYLLMTCYYIIFHKIYKLTKGNSDNV